MGDVIFGLGRERAGGVASGACGPSAPDPYPLNTLPTPLAAPQEANYYGSLTQAGTVNLGLDGNGREVFVPFSTLLPMVAPNDLVFDGGRNLGVGWRYVWEGPGYRMDGFSVRVPTT